MKTPRLGTPKRPLQPSFVRTVVSAAAVTTVGVASMAGCGGIATSEQGGYNPPGYEACPIEAPARSSACHADPAKKCSYPITDNGCSITIEIACTNGKWDPWAVSCNPPRLDACPTEAPSLGESCMNQTSPCIYPGMCGGPTAYECTTGTWQAAKITAGPAPVCPKIMPTQGSKCTSDCSAITNGECSYPTSDPCAPNRAQCVKGQWQVLQIACNPPGLDAGSPDADPEVDAGSAP